MSEEKRLPFAGYTTHWLYLNYTFVSTTLLGPFRTHLFLFERRFFRYCLAYRLPTAENDLRKRFFFLWRPLWCTRVDGWKLTEDFLKRLRHGLSKLVTFSVTIALLSKRAKTILKRNVWTRIFRKTGKKSPFTNKKRIREDGALATLWGNLYDVPGWQLLGSLPHTTEEYQTPSAEVLR